MNEIHRTIFDGLDSLDCLLEFFDHFFGGSSIQCIESLPIFGDIGFWRRTTNFQQVTNLEARQFQANLQH